MSKTWIPEPNNIDDSWADDGEKIIDWLYRSTLLRAKQMRIFLNYNLSKLPEELALTLFSNFTNRFHSAYFELIVGRLLQEIGFEFKYEQELENNKNPDFLLFTSVGEIVVEAISPIFNSSIGNFYKKKAPLIKIIRETAPKDWIVNINHLPEIGFNDSKKYFKKVIKEEFSKLHEKYMRNDILIKCRLPEGRLELHLVYKKGRKRAIGIYPPIGYAENSTHKIEKALNEKRRQLRKVNRPVILAIQGSSTGTDLEDFDNVLYGYSYEKFGHDRKMIERGFRSVGKFQSDNQNPTYQGVLAFYEVGFTQLIIPTLYLHKNADSRLINIFDSFNIRLFDEKENKIVETPAKRKDYLNNFKFIKL